VDSAVNTEVPDAAALGRQLHPAEAGDAEATVLEAAHLGLAGVGFPWITLSVDAALSVVASVAVRRTAMRLGRLAGAGLPYLASVLFAQPATFRPGPGGGAVELDGGVLGALVGIGGLSDDPVALPWLAEPLRFETAPGRWQ
jgi:hypothetical protein